MPMDGAVLAAAIKLNLQNTLPDFTSAIGDNMDAFVAAIADATVEHVQTLAVVTVTVTSVSGVTTGAGVSGAGTGTGTIA